MMNNIRMVSNALLIISLRINLFLLLLLKPNHLLIYSLLKYKYKYIYIVENEIIEFILSLKCLLQLHSFYDVASSSSSFISTK